MDSVTQVALGAAIGEAVAGKETGKRAVLWGGVAGLIPDLDVVIRPLYSQSEFLLAHRGISHSILFTVFLSLPLAWLISRLERENKVTLNKWWLLAFLGLFTHPILDITTVYGTGFLEPFSPQRLATGNINIVDPVYSLPLFIPLLIVLFKRKMKWAHNLVIGGLIFSQLYLAMTALNKGYIHRLFTDNLKQNNITYEAMMVAPSFLNNVLWYGVAVNSDTAYIGLYSHLDDDKAIQFATVPRNRDLSRQAPAEDYRNLVRFSKGFYVLNRNKDAVVLNDLRFGFIEKGRYIFTFDFSNPEKSPFGSSFSKNELRLFLYRLAGEEQIFD